MESQKIISQKINLYSLKSLLRSIITLYEEKRIISDNAKYQLDIYKEIISLINDVDLNTLFSNTLSLNLLLPLIYSQEEAENIGNKISGYAYQLIKLSNNKDLEDEYNKIIVDPPRAGLDKNTIQYLKKSNAKRIVYVSCDPVTLARDLNLLKDTYNIEEITPVDMFPYTTHVENVVLLSK